MINLVDIPGLEAIDFKKKSKLAEEIVLALSVGEQYIKRNWTKDKTTVTFYNEFKIFFDKTISKQLTEIFKNNLNMRLSSIRTISPTFSFGFFAVSLDDKDSNNFFTEIMRHSSGEVSYKKPERTTFFDELETSTLSDMGAYKKTTIDDYLDVMGSLDVSSGQFKDETLNTLSRFNWTLYLDLGCIYFMDKLIPGAAKATYEEMTAIILHEVGHVISSIENLSKYVYFTDLTKYMVRSIKKEDVGEISKKLDDKLKTMEDDIKEGKYIVTKKDISAIRRFLFNIVDALRFIPDNTPLKHIDNLLSTIVILLANAFIYIFIMIVFLTIKTLVPIFDKGEDYFRITSKDKRSDETLSNRNKYNIERRADEYVSRHGMGAHLASGLNKLMDFMILKNASKMGAVAFHKANHHSWLLKTTLGGISFIENSLGTNNIPITTYEDIYARLQRMAQNNMALFKNKDLDPQIRNTYLADTEKIMAIIEKKRKQISRKINVVTDYLIPLSLPANLLSIATTGRLAEDYEKLFKELENLTNNKVYYQATKIQSFLD
jgi:hypothetical protein